MAGLPEIAIELVWGCVCEELNVEDVMSETRFLSLWQAWRYYLLLYVALVQVRLTVGLVTVLEMTVGHRSGLVRTNSGSEGYQAESLGPIPSLIHIAKLLPHNMKMLAH